MNDLDLLHQYAETGAQQAFGTLVSRYIDLVYSAAKRQVRSPDLAKEVAQSVFLDLAGNASTLRADTHLASWLHVATRRRAIDVIRRESSRQRWEQAAAEEQAMNPPRASAPWQQLEPLIDDAMRTLNEADRAAILMRFFEERSLADVSLELECSADAAQKRISRALERLRAYFAKRGVVTVTAVLASELSAHAVELAPSELSPLIANAASSPSMVAAIASRQAAHIFTAAVLRKTALIIGLAGALGFISYQRIVLSQQEAQIRRLENLARNGRNEIDQLRAKRNRAEAAAQRSAESMSESLVSGDPEFDARVRTVLAHVAEAKRRFAQNPSQIIPELRYLSEADWFSDVQEQPRWETEEDWRQVLSSIRTRSINQSGTAFETALQHYLTKSNGQLPSDLHELVPFFEVPIDDAILARYELRTSGSAADVPSHGVVIAEKHSSAIDHERDNLAVVGVDWSGVTGAFEPSPFQKALEKAIEEPTRAYRAAHDGKDPTRPEELAPYFTDPEKREAYLDVMKQIDAQIPHFSETNAIGTAVNLYRQAHHGASPMTAAELAPYFQNLEDAALYLKMVDPQSTP